MKARGKVFISYRREGGAQMARLVRDNLRERGFEVFMDVEDLKAGPFDEGILRQIELSTDVVVILTRGSMDKCFQEGDWFRWEVAHALQCGTNVVPVKTPDFAWPSQPLPEDIRRLPYQQGVEPSHDFFDASINKLVTFLKAGPSKAKQRQMQLLLVVACLGVAALLAWFLSPHGGQPAGPGGPVPDQPDRSGWTRLFDGKTLSGWTAPDGGFWEVKDGVLTGQGTKTYLFSPNSYTNLEFKSEVNLSHHGNSGVFLRARLGKGLPPGYRAEINNTANDRIRTGSLRLVKTDDSQPLNRVTEQLVADDTWCTIHIVAIGNRIVIKVNDQIVTDFIDQQNTYTSGRLALQQLNLGTVVMFRNTVVKRLSASENEAWLLAKKDMPDIKE